MSIKIKISFNSQNTFEYHNTMEEIVKLPYYDNIIYIMCRDCGLDELPDRLPFGLRGLYCDNNNLSWLPEIPPSIRELYCSNNKIFMLPKLLYKDKDFPDYQYSKLEKLDCSHNNLSSIPELPRTLIHLNCSHNMITKLCDLPTSLNHLIISHNKIKVLPIKLPIYLYRLWCNDNELEHMPALPEYLQYLHCEHNNIQNWFHIPKKYMREYHVDEDAKLLNP